MDRPGRDDIIRILKAHFESRGDVKLALLFGSADRDQLTDASDIDVALALASGAMPLDRKVMLAQELSIKLQREVDLIDLHDAAGLILCEAIAGEVLVEDTSLRTRLALKAIDFRENLLPTIRRAQEAMLRSWVNER